MVSTTDLHSTVTHLPKPITGIVRSRSPSFARPLHRPPGTARRLPQMAGGEVPEARSGLGEVRQGAARQALLRPEKLSVF